MAPKTNTKPGLSRAEKRTMIDAAKVIIKASLPKLAAAEKATSLAKVSEMQVVLVIGKALLAVEPAFADSDAFLKFAIAETKKTRSWIYDAKNAAKAVLNRPQLASEVGSTQTAARFANLSDNEAGLVLARTKGDRSYEAVSKAISDVKSNTRGGDSEAVKARKRAEKVAKAIGPEYRRKVSKMTPSEVQQFTAACTWAISVYLDNKSGTIDALNILSQQAQAAKTAKTAKAKS